MLKKYIKYITLSQFIFVYTVCAHSAIAELPNERTRIKIFYDRMILVFHHSTIVQ
jgi:hypothetical protein